MLVDVLPGHNINYAAELLVVAAREHGEATCLFNDVPLWAGPDSTTTEVIQSYWDRRPASAPPRCKKPSRNLREALISLFR